MLGKHPFIQIKSKCEQVFKGRYQIYDEDVISDTMLSISIQFNKSKDNIQNFNAWLNGAIHHHFCSYVAKKEKEKLDLTDTTETEFVDNSTDELTSLQHQELYDEITKLKSPSKEILEMKVYQGKTYSEISSLFKMKEAAIRKHVSRSIKKISQNLTINVTIFLFFILVVVERVK